MTGGQFTGVPSFFAGASRPSVASATPGPSRQSQLGIGLGSKASAGLGKKTLRRHKKIQRDTILGVTKGDIRRLARRGGIKRISATVYDEMRLALKRRLEKVLKDLIALIELRGTKTVSVTDVVFTLNRLGTPIYGFDASFNGRER